MIYYEDEKVSIRDLTYEYAEVITEGEIRQGWDASIEKYLTRLEDAESGRAIALCALFESAPAGYVNVYKSSGFGPAKLRGLPEIVDFGVLEKFRGRGIGSLLMDAAEKLASEYSDIIYLGVGLHSGYGSAQRMYVKRGYIPDGTGVYYDDVPCAPYEKYMNDDCLNLYFTKKLR